MGTDRGITAGPVLVLGARSELGLATAERLAARGASTFVLAGRRTADLDRAEAMLRRAGATTVQRLEFDADDLARHAPLVEEVTGRFGPPSLVLLAFGVLGDQARAEYDPGFAVSVVHTDYVAPVHLLTLLANRLRDAGGGTIVVFSSVAGMRVRRANYVYGSAKAGLDGFASGLADALHASAVRLLLVRPGFVIGRMTAGRPPAPLSTTPAKVAEAVVAGLDSGRDVVWVPAVLGPVWALLRLLPRSVWRRLPR